MKEPKYSPEFMMVDAMLLQILAMVLSFVFGYPTLGGFFMVTFMVTILIAMFKLNRGVQ